MSEIKMHNESLISKKLQNLTYFIKNNNILIVSLMEYESSFQSAQHCKIKALQRANTIKLQNEPK